MIRIIKAGLENKIIFYWNGYYFINKKSEAKIYTSFVYAKRTLIKLKGLNNKNLFLDVE